MSRRSQRSIQRKKMMALIAPPTEEQRKALDDLGMSAKQAARAAIDEYLDRTLPAPANVLPSDAWWDKANRVMVLR